MPKAPGSTPSNEQMVVMVFTFNLSTWKVEAGGSGFQGQFWLRDELEASLSYPRPCVKNKIGPLKTASVLCMYRLSWWYPQHTVKPIQHLVCTEYDGLPIDHQAHGGWARVMRVICKRNATL